ncbi:hypothetical protein [Deinococcus sp.]|uniref:hypothetical protein n=1 Tax=Deinococcus sp. TaxID=47478 RepID=UPI003C7C5C0D
MKRLHELWTETHEDERVLGSFMLAGPEGDARKLFHPTARLVWTVWAENHFEAMTAYYGYMN